MKYINIITQHIETLISETAYGYQFDENGVIYDVLEMTFKRWYLPYNEENLIKAKQEYNRIFRSANNTEKEYEGELDNDE